MKKEEGFNGYPLSILKMKRNAVKPVTHEECELAIEEYLKKGGQIKKINVFVESNIALLDEEQQTFEQDTYMERWVSKKLYEKRSSQEDRLFQDLD